MNSTKFVIIWAVTCLAEPTVRERRKVCYEEVGCFDLEAPWFGLTRPLPAPQSPAKIKLRFYLMTRNTMDRPINELKILTTDFYRPTLESLNELDYQSSRIRTAVHVHGMFLSQDWNWPLQKKLAMAYLHKEDVNIIFVSYDAKIFRLRNIYFRMVANIRVVGAIAARQVIGSVFFEQLMELTDLKADQIHILGFSLGAHVAGYIGKRIPNIYRITGLDPARPLFENADPLYRLAHTDAEHVDVLHTNTNKLLPVLGLGYGSNVGDVDFYFNDSIVQPGCITNHIRRVLRKYFRLYLKKAIRHTFFMMVCSHLRVIDYWTESLENSHCIMWGIETHLKRISGNTSHRCTPVGLDTFNFVLSGTYKVPTRSSSPYCIPTYFILECR